MTKKNKWLRLAAAAVLLAALCVSIAACSRGGGQQQVQEGPSQPSQSGTVGTQKQEYTLVLTTEGGKPLEDVGVYFYTDSTMAELVWFAKTDAEGKAAFTDLASGSYVAVLDKVPEGYRVEEYYPLTGAVTQIVLSTDMSEGDLASVTYKLGDVMKNFSVTGPDGTVYVLSELLQEKQAVVLNFWYLECAPCRAEFPYLQEAYKAYGDQIEVLALNPVNEDNEAITAFREELKLTFPMMHCDPAWAEAMELTAYPTTVVIDRYGTIALIHKGSVDETKTFTDAFAFFTAEDYEQTTVKKIEDLEIKAEGSDSTNPIEIGGKTSFTVTVNPGQLVYYHLYRLDGMYLTINNSYAYAVYESRTIYASGGTLGFTVNCPDTYTPAKMAFGNSGTTTQTYSVKLEAAKGSFNNPYTLKTGTEFTTKVAAGNDQGVYYLYTAKEDGLLTVQCVSISKDVKYDYTLLNENTMAMRTMAEDGDETEKTVSVPVKKGHKVRLTIGTLPDESNTYPSATFKSKATMGENTSGDEDEVEIIDYAVTVTDENRKPISGVVIKLKSPETTETDTAGTAEKAGTQKVDVTKATDKDGVITTRQAAGTYDVIVTLPENYTAATSTFQITEEQPFVSLKLEPLVVELKTYTVTVTDAEGSPLSGVMVLINGELQTTGTEGRASFELPKSSYIAYITAPSGYTAASEGYPFAPDSTELTVALEAGSEEDPGDSSGMKEYTVTVLDYQDNPQPNVYVQIMKGNSQAAIGKTDADGVVTTSLEADDYTVKLVGSRKNYEEKRAVLPKGTTSLTIRVASGVGNAFEMIYDTYTAYYVGLGGTYVKMQANVDNYYIFQTNEPGQYRFTTSDPDAKISYWGASTSFINKSLEGYDEATNSFIRNIKASNIPEDGYHIVIIGITGDPDCILEITRIGDALLDETDLEPVIYEAKTPPKAFDLKASDGKKLIYVDISGKTSDYRIVMGSDGYYHLNSAGGPLLYMNLGPSAPYLQMYNMLGYQGYGGTSLACVFRDGSGAAIRKEDYTACMCEYVESIDGFDPNTNQCNGYGVYPLTEDLVYMIQNGGGYKGWWNPEDGNYLFMDAKGNADLTVNQEIAWMFAVCYVP